MTRVMSVARWGMVAVVVFALSGCRTAGQKTGEVAGKAALEGVKEQSQQAQAAGKEPAAATASRDVVRGTIDELSRPEQMQRMRALINAAVAEALMTAARPMPPSAWPPPNGGAAGTPAPGPDQPTQSLAQVLAGQVASATAAGVGAAVQRAGGIGAYVPECSGLNASDCLEKLGHATSKGMVAGAIDSFGGYVLAFLGGAIVAALLIVAGMGATRFGRTLRERRQTGSVRR